MIFDQTGTMFVLAYLLGSIPFGYIIVKLFTGKDIRFIQSGRTGGTNTMRAAGFLAGMATALLDISKSALAVLLAKRLPQFQDPWLLIMVPILVIIGNNYSIFMISRKHQGTLKVGGGAGGAACLGGTFGLWWPSGVIVLVIAALVFYFIGYASVTTMSIAFVSTLVFTVRSIMTNSPWEYAVYGLLAEVLLVISLLPNIKRLKAGTERLHGLRAKRLHH